MTEAVRPRIGPCNLDRLLDGLRAVAEPSRLRLLAICAEGEWTVSELVQVLGQSQPRVSRHLRLLSEAGLLERFREGSWVFYRRAARGEGAALARALTALLPDDDPVLALDRDRLAVVRETRRNQIARWFDERAAAWDSERDLAVDGGRVEAVLQRLFAARRPRSLLDIGTGTGRILEVLAPYVEEGLGIDLSRDMLAVARDRLDRARLRHCQVRQADMYRLPIPSASFAAATLHQVLHFADDPLRVLAEARRVLAPGGLLVVVDLAAHHREDLRIERRHRRLGFAESEMSAWFAELGLVEEPPVRLSGRELTSVVWTARVAGEAVACADREQQRLVA
ncbi:MAG: metalloregulator ArsR/SmtB family transcription factor [Geminicoccaceae bacterium]|nr:metalloregulator ArsR/SmtB family transcription factor [Geminicoccaceae bacterium]MCX8099697.1 metalloregulator ArsR/SmtB family transcription factor [Geminicoccaceae bacterium]MDW8369992.1 metalloregulator ArsR/SmtB family transcription factor [Geminicoccaceae bacterium]